MSASSSIQPGGSVGRYTPNSYSGRCSEALQKYFSGYKEAKVGNKVVSLAYSIQETNFEARDEYQSGYLTVVREDFPFLKHADYGIVENTLLAPQFIGFQYSVPEVVAKYRGRDQNDQIAGFVIFPRCKTDVAKLRGRTYIRPIETPVGPVQPVTFVQYSDSKGWSYRVPEISSHVVSAVTGRMNGCTKGFLYTEIKSDSAQLGLTVSIIDGELVPTAATVNGLDLQASVYQCVPEGSFREVSIFGSVPVPIPRIEIALS